MDNNMFGFKDLYDCVLKATYDIEIGNRVFKAGEPIVAFDSLSLANFDELKRRATANGGYGNQAWVAWESTQEVHLNFSQGIFSTLHLAILGNSNMSDKGVVVAVPMHEEKEIDDNLQVQLKYNPKEVYVYGKKTNVLLNDFNIENNILTFNGVAPYTDVDIYYSFDYENANVISIGRQLVRGFLEFTAKTRLKDDMTGKTVTAIIQMPRVKLMSDFSIRLGKDAPPTVGHFAITAYPVGSKGSETVMNFISLNDDVDSDF